MLDFQLAELYGMETKVLYQSVKRNIERFDSDFMFQLNSSDLAEVRSQIVTLHGLTHENPIGKFLPSPSQSSASPCSQACCVPAKRVDKLENDSRDVRQTFSEVFERLDNVEQSISTRAPIRRRKIGLKT